MRFRARLESLNRGFEGESASRKQMKIYKNCAGRRLVVVLQTCTLQGSPPVLPYNHRYTYSSAIDLCSMHPRMSQRPFIPKIKAEVEPAVDLKSANQHLAGILYASFHDVDIFEFSQTRKRVYGFTFFMDSPLSSHDVQTSLATKIHPNSILPLQPRKA